jgi:mannose-6-phosphate isomerase-like protein (cupin superfamily)
MKKGFKDNLENITLQNNSFRKVVYTGEHMQLVLMSLRPGEDIGLEVHEGGDQFFRFEEGSGKVIINETEYEVGSGDGVIVPAGAKHNVINTSSTQDLKLYTIYAPSHHLDGIERVTKEEAVKSAPEFDGKTTE